MWESKWGVLERFRVRPEWRGRVLAEDPELLTRTFAARATLLEGGAFVLGPFAITADDGTWWTVLWQFPSLAEAERFERMAADPQWTRCVESRLARGQKFDPQAPLPDF